MASYNTSEKVRFHTYLGAGSQMSDAYGYSQSVSIPATARIVYTAGNGGWNTKCKMVQPYPEQVKQAFYNLEACLKASGATFADVVKIESFHTMSVKSEETMAPLVEFVKANMPQRPTMTSVTVSELALEGMYVEIQLTAVVNK